MNDELSEQLHRLWDAGTGTLTLGAAVVPFQSFANAGAVTNKRYSILIEQGNDWEISEGVYNSVGPTITRVLVASSTGALLNLTGAGATVAIVAKATDHQVEIGEHVAVGGETTLFVADIPDKFKDLVITFSMNGTVNEETQLRFNDDASAIYDTARHYGGASTNSDRVINQTSINRLSTISNVANIFTSYEAVLIAYAKTDRHKNLHGKGFQASSGHTIDSVGTWKSTAAVNKVSVVMPTATLNAGSYLRVYGR